MKRLAVGCQHLQKAISHSLEKSQAAARVSNNSFYNNIGYFCFVFAIVGCASMSPKNFSQFTEGEWDGKVLIRDSKNSKSGIVNVKVKAIAGDRMRIDVTSNIGTHVASILIIGDQVEYLNIADKALYKTKANRDSLKDIFKIPIEPKNLHNVFFDQAMTEKNWSCESDAKGLVRLCKDKKTGLKIEWLNRDGERRTIGFEHGSVTVQMSLYEFDAKVSNAGKAFEIKAPSSFQIKQI